MKEIGGFFELELNYIKEYHEDALALNTGRNCLEYILMANDFVKIYIPYFICEVILEPLKKCSIEYEFYNIDKNFNPIFDYNILSSNEAFLYVNYFGIKECTVGKLARYIDNLIIDNTQAFFAKPIDGVDTFYSPRKFVGVADGGYLYTNSQLDFDLQKDKSCERMSHLLSRIENGSQVAYELFRENSKVLGNNDIFKMSTLTKKILSGINYNKIKKIREQNFIFLHKFLEDNNELNLSLDNLNGPMVYPYLINDDSVRRKLIENKVFVAQYWPNVLEWCEEKDLEFTMTKYLLPLPIDQRYSIKEMENIIKILE
jgi:hypothetical protein